MDYVLEPLLPSQLVCVPFISYVIFPMRAS